MDQERPFEAPAPPGARTRRGREAEDIAERWLRASGYAILARNVRYRRGELDIVARQGGVIVFVEVRARRAGGRFDPAATLGRAKHRALRRAAVRWLARHGAGNLPARFDIVAVEIGPGGFRVRHLPGAFAFEG